MSTVKAPPDRVTGVAAERGLGPLLAASKGSNPFTNFLFALVVAALCVGAMVAVGSLGWRFLRPVLILALAFSLLWVFYGVVALVMGFQRFFLYAGGVVRWRNGRLRVIRWQDVVSVQRTRAFGRRTGYQLTVAGGGRPLVVEAVEGNEAGDEMASRLEEALVAAGRAPWG
jgi:hypothetical protein